jgi:raffinose/stachyose/melibiose transport system substrate-binding protein
MSQPLTLRRRSLGLVALASLAAGRAGAQTPPVTLQVWSWQAPMAAIYRRIFEIYETANPGIRVEYRGFPGTEYPTVLKTGLSAPGGPDIVMLHPYRAIAPYTRAGQLQPLDEAAIPELANFSPASLAAARLDGKLWGVPFARQSVQVYYNRKIFADLGLAPPARQSDLTPLLEKIAAAGITPLAVTGKDAWQLVNVFDALFGPIYGGADFIARIKAGTAEFTDPAFVAALTAFAATVKYFPKFASAVSHADARALFATGKAAMFPGGSWELGVFQNSAVIGDVGVFSMPADGAGPAPTWGYEDGSLAIAAQSAHKAEAMALLRWMGSPAFGQAFTDQLKQPSSMLGVVPTDKVLAQMVANLQANPVPMIWATDYFGVASPAPYAALMNGCQKLISGSTTPREAAASVAQSVVEWNALNK